MVLHSTFDQAELLKTLLLSMTSMKARGPFQFLDLADVLSCESVVFVNVSSFEEVGDAHI